MNKTLTATAIRIVLRKLFHYLFECPTFWRLKPAFECPLCKTQYRCYWDGCDEAGHINLCFKCAYSLREKQEKANAAEPACGFCGGFYKRFVNGNVEYCCMAAKVDD